MPGRRVRSILAMPSRCVPPQNDIIAINGAPDRLFQCAGFAIAAFVDQVARRRYRALAQCERRGRHACGPRVRAGDVEAGCGCDCADGVRSRVTSGLFGWSVYAATKHAVVGFASSLRNELKPFGVSVQALCPPATQTPGFDRENATKPRSVRKAEEAGGVMSAEAVARAAWARCGRGGLYIIPNRTSRILFALSRVSTDLAQSFVRAPGPGKPR